MSSNTLSLRIPTAYDSIAELTDDDDLGHSPISLPVNAPIDFDLSKVGKFEGIIDQEMWKRRRKSFPRAYRGFLKEVCEALYFSFTGRDLRRLVSVKFLEPEEMRREAGIMPMDYGEPFSDTTRTTGGLRGDRVDIRIGQNLFHCVITMMHEAGGAMVTRADKYINENELSGDITYIFTEFGPYYIELAQMAFDVACLRKLNTELAPKFKYRVNYPSSGAPLYDRARADAIQLIDEGTTPLRKCPEKYGL
ncbi:MAG: hypothetical protein HYX24_03645 [Candidatus Aenigmarchaeota archaeon]|nr:hypothetical protein [Candidatus Aenigmarchaeota archaeon]